MSNILDRSLDEILADRKKNNFNRGSRGGASRRRERDDRPRDGVRKSFRDDEPRNLDSEWVHDKFEDDSGRRPAASKGRRRSPEPNSDPRGTKLRVDNLHYELTQQDLEGLFSRIGPVISVHLKYDRAGRSEGVAFVTYEHHRDAVQAIKEFDGANAAGQPIRLTLLPSGPSSSRGSGRNPFDSAVKPSVLGTGRPLAERITVSTERVRSRSLSPGRDNSGEENGRGRGRRGGGVDRYRPRSRSPPRRRDGGGNGSGRRSGPGPKRGGRDPRLGRDGRPKKTQEELDAEMEDYFASVGAGNQQQQAQQSEGGNAAPHQEGGEDVDMIE